DVEDPVVDLFAAETASVLAWTDYFVGNALDTTSKLLRPRITYEVKRRILDPIMIAKYNWLKKPDVNNWVPWIMSNCITASLILEKDEKKRSELVYFAMKNTDKYINNLGEDGAVNEGPSYWFHAVGCTFDVLDLLESATNGKVSIYKEPIVQGMASYIYKMHISDNYFINVADASPQLNPDGLAIFRYGKSVGNEKMMAFGSWAFHRKKPEALNIRGSNRSRKLFNILAKNECDAYPSELPKVGDIWFPSIQLMSARSKGLFVASHGGHNAESHNHNDVGDFIVYAAGYPVIIDVGIGTYTAKTFSKDRYKIWNNSSGFHNLPIINGAQQNSGRAAEATEVKYQNSKNATSLSMDISSAYPDSVVNSWKRKIELDKKGVLQIIDTYQLPKTKNTIDQVFMTTCNTQIDKPGRIVFELPNKQTVVLQYNATDWVATKEKLILNKQEDPGIVSNWDGKDIWRLMLTQKTNESSGTATYLINLK
ncbi:MAG TPA: heparinase II/III family protein, partial [Pelobium sp.]|nr:heparinase II/III family protein [Pelobium sp.]